MAGCKNNIHKILPLFRKRETSYAIYVNFTGEAREMAPFYALKTLSEEGYFPPNLVILEYKVVTILHIIHKETWDERFATRNSV
jgi:hypothetical protein